MRYHVIVLGDSIQVRSKNLTFVHARQMKQRLKSLYPSYQFKAVPSDAWNRIVEYLEKL